MVGNQPTKGNHKKAAILEAAARLFQEKGYASTSMEDIGQAVGLLKGSLYSHFDSKEDILREIVVAPFTSALDSLEAVVNSDLSPIDKLERALQLHVELFDEFYPAMSVGINGGFGSASTDFRREVSGFRSRTEALWDRLIAEGVRSGDFRADLDTRVVCYAILGMCNWMCKWYRKGGRLSSSAIADQYCRFVAQGMINGVSAPKGNLQLSAFRSGASLTESEG